MKKNNAPASKITTSRVRVIGGKWRGRGVHFPALPGLRPTPDRVRETLFNWLAPVISGATCLDAFAGSGVLGIEALSRGASWVTFVDKQRKCIEAIKKQLILFDETTKGKTAFVVGNVKTLPLVPPQPFSIVFLDPPFNENLLPAMVTWLASEKLLAPTAYIYAEMERGLDCGFMPAEFELLKLKKAGRVQYGLWARSA